MKSFTEYLTSKKEIIVESADKKEITNNVKKINR